jgi:phosphoribosylformimino-5-aminoimidazole carboxamide ribotide isomerase
VKLYPAVDILGGSAVRLQRGDYAQKTVYDEHPLSAARGWVSQGAQALHVVDLDGARSGRPGNLAARVILGTAALTDSDLLAQAVAELGAQRVTVAVDVRAGHAAASGWTEASELTAPEALERMQRSGAQRFVYTSVDRDGMLGGPDLEGLQTVAASLRDGGELTYSGGIGELGHLEDLARLRAPGLTGVIVGKALYEQRFTVSEAQAALEV